MAAIYESIVYDLNDFGIDQIQSAIISSDKDDGVSIEVSFNGGSSFLSVNANEKIDISNSTNKIKVRIIFNNDLNGIYKIPMSGNYQMLSIGTSLFFQNNSNKKTYSTTIGMNGKYNISLFPGIYSVWYIANKNEKIYLTQYLNTNIPITEKDSTIKENTVEMFFRDVDWTKYCIFDVFENLNKMSSGTVELNPEGNLIDTKTNKICRWWAVGLA